MKNFGRAGHFAQNAPITISQDTRGHPCVFLGQKVLNRAAQIRETAFKESDEGLELYLKPQSHKELNCAHNI